MKHLFRTKPGFLQFETRVSGTKNSYKNPGFRVRVNPGRTPCLLPGNFIEPYFINNHDFYVAIPALLIRRRKSRAENDVIGGWNIFNQKYVEFIKIFEIFLGWTITYIKNGLKRWYLFYKLSFKSLFLFILLWRHLPAKLLIRYPSLPWLKCKQRSFMCRCLRQYF